mgnify:CR=1 FL=1
MPVKRRPRISCLIFVESVSIFCPSRSFPPFRANLSRLNFHVLESNFVLSRMIATSLVRIHVSIGETLFIRPGGRQALCGEFTVPFQNNSDLYKAIHGDATRLQISVNENERTYCFAAWRVKWSFSMDQFGRGLIKNLDLDFSRLAEDT